MRAEQEEPHKDHFKSLSFLRLAQMPQTATIDEATLMFLKMTFQTSLSLMLDKGKENVL